ncbi:unnamed protein product [Blepharisma stoltei]|uniref:Uncharacterized protein n=1 Tax=Blepharisma stoltei TaxID=1481888 RepID=A0AAU9IVW1_9CILI|nr:unnamed protein product [Blepharisma stoltei]
MDLKRIIIFSSVALLFSWVVYFMINLLDIFVVTNKHHHETCEVLDLPLAPEDIEIYGSVIIAALDDRIPHMFRHQDMKSAKQGLLVWIDPKTKKWAEIPISNFPSGLPFHPHGTFLYKNSTLYMVNHALGQYGERIEVFSLVEDGDRNIKATYLRSAVFPDNWHGIINDVVVYKEGHFYATQWMPIPDTPEGRDHSFLTSFIRTAKMFFYKNSYVYSCFEKDGKAECTPQHIAYINNGANLIGNQLLVADTYPSVVNIYDIQSDMSLKYVESVKFPHHLDNISIEPNGSALVVGITRMVEFVILTENLKAGKPKSVMGSGVSRMSKVNGKWEVKELLMQDTLFASAAIILDDTILIGSIIDNAALVCKVKS